MIDRASSAGLFAVLAPLMVYSLTEAEALPSGEDVWVFLRDKPDGMGGRIDWGEREDGEVGEVLDLPLDPDYIVQVEETGLAVRNYSRWFNAVSVRANRAQQDRLGEMDFVRHLRPVRRLRRPSAPREPADDSTASKISVQEGPFPEHLEIIGVTGLHNQGYKGEGVRIALLDNGFHYLDHKAFSHFQVVAARDFVNGDDVVTDEANQPVTGDETVSNQNIHGARVLSLLVADDPEGLAGVTPEAEYILAKTEDNGAELPIEEDRWIAGLEWADSLGADIVSSSLGYTTWDDDSGYAFEDLDGETALTSIAAGMAVRRGIIVVLSAGNQGNNWDWPYITVPADAPGVIAVGAVDRRLKIASFSSRGPTADGRIKPDVVAPGQEVPVPHIRRGDYTRMDGTSFAAPLVSGVCALLLQIHPSWDPEQMLDKLRATATDLGEAGEDTVYGWGLVHGLRASGLVIEPLLLADSAVDFSLDFSAMGDGHVGNGSTGEVPFSVRFSDNRGAAGTGQIIVWDITNNGAESVFLIGDGGAVELVAGASLTTDSTTDSEGMALVTFDAEGDKTAGRTSISVVASTSAPNSDNTIRELRVEYSITWVVRREPFPSPATMREVYFPLHLGTQDEAEVALQVFDLAGRLVAELEAGDYSPSKQALRWDIPEKIANGLYFYRLTASTFTRSGKIAILR